MSDKLHQVLYTFHLITVKVVKLTSASRWWRIYFCNDIMDWDPANVLSTRLKELGRRIIWVKKFNVRVTIFYWNIVCNSKVPFIILRTSMKRFRRDVLNWISKFLEATPDTQFITMFSPPGVNSWFLWLPLKVLQF